MYLLYFSECWADTRYILESFILYTFIILMCNLLKCLNESLLKAKHRNSEVNACLNDCLHTTTFIVTVSTEQVEKWVENYILLVNYSRILSSCFKTQVKK